MQEETSTETMRTEITFQHKSLNKTQDTEPGLLHNYISTVIYRLLKLY